MMNCILKVLFSDINSNGKRNNEVVIFLVRGLTYILSCCINNSLAGSKVFSNMVYYPKICQAASSCRYAHFIYRFDKP